MLVLVWAGEAVEVVRIPQALEVSAADEQVHLDALDLFTHPVSAYRVSVKHLGSC